MPTAPEKPKAKLFLSTAYVNESVVEQKALEQHQNWKGNQNYFAIHQDYCLQIFQKSN